MIVYANSDSIGVMTQGNMRYPEFVGQMLGATKVINPGRMAACNRRIVRTTLRDCIALRQADPTVPVVCLVALGSMIRGEWWNPDMTPVNNDGHFQSFQIHGENSNRKHAAWDYTQEWFRHFDIEAETTNLYCDLVMLTAWLRQHNIHYLIFAGNSFTYKDIDFNGPFIKDFAGPLHADAGVLPLTKFSVASTCWDAGFKPYDRDDPHGHWLEPAHQFFAERLVEIYKSVYNNTAK